MQQLKVGSSLQGGKYKIEKVLGQGGFGITYLATQELLDRKVCIKEFFFKEYCERDEATSHVTLGTQSNHELVERFMTKFLKEARTISQLEHPHIIRIHDIFKENNTAYYVMEYIEGESLNDIVNQSGALPESEAVEYIKQVASALDFIHQRSINHLDVKPANIMIRKSDNKAVLIDFGLSKQYDSQGGQTSTTPVGISHGYAPMEQYNVGGVSMFSSQTDIYSLGATLYKLVTGQTPPQASDVLNEGLPEFPSALSSKVKNAINQAMQVRKKDRPEDVRAFLDLMKTSTCTMFNEETKVIQTQPKQVEDEATMVLDKPEVKERVYQSHIDNSSKPKISFDQEDKDEKNNKFSWKWFIAAFFLFGIIFYIWNESEKTEEIDYITTTMEMKQQLINDSIAAVRKEEFEKKRQDSINAIKEQARLAEIRKQEEKKRMEETPEELYKKGLKYYNNSQMPIQKKAIPFFEKAANQGHVKSMYYLGEWYTSAGRKEEEGVMWWEKAAEKDSFDAMCQLGRYYFRYNPYSGNYKNKERAYKWLEKAASSGHLDAQTFLGHCFFMDNQDANALYWWEKAASKGYCKAYQELGDYYRGSVRGKVIDYKKAIEWYEKAANIKTSEGRYARSLLVNIYYKKEEYRNLNRAKYWCQVIIADGCRHQIDNEILDYFGL